jgi:hypothetical protein
MTRRLGKSGLILLALVLVLGVTGAAFAKWSETLTISGVVNTGEVDVGFSQQVSNDPTSPGQNDEAGCGSWPTWVDGDAYPTADSWSGTRYDKNVGSIDCELSDGDGGATGGDEVLTITVTNGYPCYYGNIWFTIDNLGSIPVKIESIKLVEVSKGGTPHTVDVDLVAGTAVYVNADTGAVQVGGTVDESIHDFSLQLSTLALGVQIEPAGETGDEIPGDLCVHVEQAAEEGASYDFTIEIVATQWNEVT